MCFNSRTLGRVRQEQHGDTMRLKIVSIHAPWEGCDNQGRQRGRSPRSFNSRTLGRVRPGILSSVPSSRRFNSRTLGRVRRSLIITQMGDRCVSIHAPWEGCDQKPIWRSYRVRVSIHAPWEGCDRQFGSTSYVRFGFNSRTLGRVRLGVQPKRLDPY